MFKDKTQAIRAVRDAIDTNYSATNLVEEIMALGVKEWLEEKGLQEVSKVSDPPPTKCARYKECRQSNHSYNFTTCTPKIHCFRF